MKRQAASALLLLGLTLVPPAGMLAGCETVQLGGVPKDTTGTASGTATIAFTNRRETDAGVLTFNLYPARAVLLASPVPHEILGKVGYSETKTFTVPTGRWKLGYEEDDGTFKYMPDSTAEGGSQDWPTVLLSKDIRYQIVLETDQGGNTLWRHDVPQAE